MDVHVSNDTARLSIAVRDDGPGIPSSQLKKLLNRDGWQPGGALALLLVDDVAAAHGGDVQIESQVAPSVHFTLVRFTVPAPEHFDHTADVR